MKSLDPWDYIQVSPSGDVYYPGNVYEHPFYQEVPSWIHYGPSSDRTRQLFDGAFIGADYAGADMQDIGGITFKKELDAQQVLHVEICVDGKCHRTAMDLAPAISLIMDKLAKWHLARHAPTDPKMIVGAVEAAIGEAGDAMIGMLADRHARGVAIGDFFGDIGSALSSAANAIGGVLKDLKGPISAAAGAAATAYGGPAAGPIASQLAGSIVDAAPGGSHPAKQAAAKRYLVTARHYAQTNPTVQTALDAANHATSQVTTAALGHPAIPQTQGTLGSAVQKLLPVVTKAFSGTGGGGDTSSLPSNLQSALSTFGNMLGSGSGGGGGNGGVDFSTFGSLVDAGDAVSGYPALTVGDFWDDVGDAILTVTGTKATNQFIHDNHLEGLVQLAGTAVATYYGGPAAGMAAKTFGPSIMSLGVKDDKKAAAAKQHVQTATTLAQRHSPEMAQAVNVAKNSINNAATAYHINHLLKGAKSGDARSQLTLNQLQDLAASGNPNAQKALQAMDAIHQGQEQAPPGVSGWYDIVGAVIGCGCGN